MTENRIPEVGDEIYLNVRLVENNPNITTAWVQIDTVGSITGSLIVEVPKSSIVLQATEGALEVSPEKAIAREKINKITQVLRSEGGMSHYAARSVAESLYLAGVQVDTPEEQS